MERLTSLKSDLMYQPQELEWLDMGRGRFAINLDWPHVNCNNRCYYGNLRSLTLQHYLCYVRIDKIKYRLFSAAAYSLATLFHATFLLLFCCTFSSPCPPQH